MKSGRRPTQKDKDRFLEALQKRKGIVTLACREVSINPITFYRWQRDDPDFYKKSEEIRDSEIGIIAEDRLSEAIIVDKDMSMVRFYLQSRNPKFKQSVEISEPVKVQFFVPKNERDNNSATTRIPDSDAEQSG